MSLLADRIEKLILEKLLEEQEENLILKRNELADELDCAPSQISYVLSTRFSNEKGFNVESRRGLGGFISITRIHPTEGTVHTEIRNQSLVPVANMPRQAPLGDDMPKSIQEIDRWLGMLLFQERIDNREARILHSAFEAMFTQVPAPYANDAIRYLYRSVLQEVRGE